jgi:hypothetical protein
MHTYPVPIPGVESTDNWSTVCSPFDGLELGKVARIDAAGAETSR